MSRSHLPRRAKSRRGSRTQAAQKRVTAKVKATSPVVAVGASAGGLEAFRTLLAALPAESGMAFILVQHLDPSHTSMMVELLSPCTAMPVLEAGEGARLQPGHVYINPPGRYLAIRNGTVHLSRPPATKGVRMQIDFLLQSLAEELGERVVCLILSGTGTDGSVGAKAIKEAGGLVIAQDPDEAEYDGMPRSAIATGAVDLVLRLADVPKTLATYGGHRYLSPGKSDSALPLGDAIAQIIDLLRKKTSHDFTLYKEGTLGRRIERRMAIAGIEDSKRYLDLLTKDPAELERLFKDLFINVTRFFRDATAYEVMAKKIVPELVRAQPPGQPIRIWVAGCSTGEEAYSIAMIFLEEIAAARRNMKLQIFATDVDDDALASAREGLYPPLIEADVPPAQLTRFFTREDQGYRVSRELRSAIVFSVHDLVADAPFSRLDLISCRNLLIYLRPEVQQKVLSLFRFSLREGGMLFLGLSETVRGASDYFDPVSQKERIYRHIGHPRPGEVALPVGGGTVARTIWHRTETRAAAPRSSVSEYVQRLLLETYAPASVLVNRKHQGLYYYGAIDHYLKMPTGLGTLDLLASAREGLRPAIRAAFDKVSLGQETSVAIAGHVNRNGGSVGVTVRAQPVKKDDQELVLLSFLDEPTKEKEAEAVVGSTVDAPQNAQVEQELEATRKELEDAIREREIAEEEMRAINEEAMSVNEEFQSTNEELETSKEELQSLNEELTVLNSQLQETLDEHKSVANDLENILTSADLATLFLDEKLNIRFFTPATTSLFSLIASDVGRPLGDLANHFADGNLLADAKRVLANLTPITREIEAENGASYTCRVLPYRTKDNRIEGVVITFVDVTARKRAEVASHAATLLAQQANLGKSRFLAAASHDLRQPLQTLSFLQGLLAKKMKDGSGAKLVEKLAETIGAMSGMLNTLLDINQLEAGIVRPEIIAFRVSTLLERLKTEFTYHTAAKGLDLRVVMSHVKLRSDPRLIEQMLRNLLANAVKYTHQGKVLLGCRRRGNKLRIEVWDTGIGISPGQLKAIFKEFHQIGNDARERSRGLGLGLAIVDRLGHLLGHTVDVHSWPGYGSAFTIEVPIARDKEKLQPQNDGDKAKTTTGLVGEILIIEDDHAVREMLEILCEEEGHRTTVVTNTDEALALMARGGALPDVIVADYNLPGDLTGTEVVAQLRASQHCEIPAIVLTGDISNDTLYEISRSDCVYLAKPVTTEALTRQIQVLLATKRRPGAREKERPPVDATDGSQPTIFLVDDDRTLLDALQEFLQDHGHTVEAYTSAPAFLEACGPGRIGCLVVDAVMPEMGGIALLKRLKALGRSLAAIMITGEGDVAMAVQAMKAGATDFLEKPVSPDQVLASINGALERLQEPTNVMEQRRRDATARFARLTPRQRTIMELIIQGRPNKIIAYELGISQRTVESHRAAIMRRVGVKSLPDLVRLAIAAK